MADGEQVHPAIAVEVELERPIGRERVDDGQVDPGEAQRHGEHTERVGEQRGGHVGGGVLGLLGLGGAEGTGGTCDTQYCYNSYRLSSVIGVRGEAGRRTAAGQSGISSRGFGFPRW